MQNGIFDFKSSRRGRSSIWGDDYIYIRDEKPDATSGGNFEFAAWRTRTLNTIVTDDGKHATLRSNQIRLPAGIYRFNAQADAFAVGPHKLRLQNMTASMTVGVGASCYADAASAVQTTARVRGHFTINVASIFELQHYGNVTNADGFGKACSFGPVEVYAEIEFWKEHIR